MRTGVQQVCLVLVRGQGYCHNQWLIRLFGRTGSDVSASLRDLARKRGDIFSTAGMSEAEKAKAAQEEARRKAKDREAVVWDGHVASGELTTNRFQTGANLNQQIEAIHRAKGLTACV